MNKNKVIALVLATLGLVVLVALGTNECRALVEWFGKAAWYIPYAALVAGIKFLVG